MNRKEKLIKIMTMKEVLKNFKHYSVYLMVFCMAFSLQSCSNDDDGVAEIEPTGLFEVGEEFTLSGNSITLESITVEQDSWLVAVEPGNEDTNTFIADPVMLEDGLNTDIELTFDEGAITDDGSGQDVVLKLYADDPTQGTPGEWDSMDEPITNTNNVLLTETITVFAEDDGTATFADFDTNNDGMLDNTEVTGIYENNFEEWDTNDDDVLSQDEFNTTTFSLTDMNDDDGIDEAEWNDGYSSFFGNWNEDDFATFDEDSDGWLDPTEWNNAFADSEWFGTFDANADDSLDEDEWDTGLFNDWDTDDNEEIDEDEFNVFSDFTMDW